MEYTTKTILNKVEEYFSNLGYECQRYSDRLGEVRIPLFCVKKENDEITDLIVVDIITEERISKSEYLPSMDIEGTTIEFACAPKFFQYYLHQAKVYWAYGANLAEDNKYRSFKAACRKNGIGLLKVADNIDLVLEASNLLKQFTDEIDKEIRNSTLRGIPQRDQVFELVKKSLERLQEENIHYLIYYGAPRFQRREITKRETQDLSLILINKLLGIKKLEYSGILASFARTYRKADKSDYELALSVIKRLWRDRFDLEYPNVQKDFESILLLNPKYRDHFLHQFQVFLLGAVILDGLYRTRLISTFNRVNRARIEDAWLAAATYHDFYFPIQLTESWMTQFFKKFFDFTRKKIPLELKFEEIIIRDEFLYKMQSLCKVIGCALDDCLIRFIIERVAVDKNHAVLSAFGLFREFNGNEKLSENAINIAAASILLHDKPNWECFSGKFDNSNKQDWEQELCCRNLLPQLQFMSLPIAFLLAFCDSVQEWGREGRGYETVRPELLNLEVTPQKISIAISLEDNDSFRIKFDELEKLKQYLDDARFEITLSTPQGGQIATLPMTGR